MLVIFAIYLRTFFFHIAAVLSIHTNNQEVKTMARLKKNPSERGVSAASLKGNAGPTVEADGGGKRTSQNQQYKKHNMQGD